MPRVRSSGGFTLIELVLVAGIMAVIGLTMASTFAGGLKIFYRMENFANTRADVLISMEKLERDLRNTLSYAGIDFIGEAKRVTFPAITRTTSSKGALEESVGAVSYFRDDSKKIRTLSREEKKYSVAAKNKEAGRGIVTPLSPIEDISFKYFSYDPDSETYAWVDVWDKTDEAEKKKEEEGGTTDKPVSLEDTPENIPLGVKIEISYKDDGKIVKLNRSVFIKPPVSLNKAKIKARLKKEESGE